VGGTDDIGRAIVRTIGDPRRRFAEDHLRLLRAIRFAVRLGFEIDPETWEAIRSQAARIGRIARERIGAEILSIVGSPDPARGVELLHRSGLLAHVLPELADRTPEGNGSNPGAGPTLSVLRSLEDPTPEVALAALVHDLGADEEGVSGTIGRRLALSRRSVRAVEDLLRLRPAFDRGAEQSLADLKGLLARDDIEDHLAFHRARLVGSGQGTETFDLYREWLARAALDRDCIDPPPLIDGRDLLSLGFGSGPEIGRTLEAIRRDQLDEAIGTREEALARARPRLEPGFIPEAT
jgi:poly(A) polymerase